MHEPTHTYTEACTGGKGKQKRERTSEAWIMGLKNFTIAAGVWIYWMCLCVHARACKSNNEGEKTRQKNGHAKLEKNLEGKASMFALGTSNSELGSEGRHAWQINTYFSTTLTFSCIASLCLPSLRLLCETKEKSGGECLTMCSQQQISFFPGSA